MNYKIVSINQKTGVPTITYTTGEGNTNTENLSNAVGLDKDGLDTFMRDYMAAFDTGKTIENQAPPIDQSMTDIVGQEQEI